MKRALFLILLVLSLSSCDDIIEVVDISQNTISVLAPTNTSVLAEGDITFSWDVLQDATQYKLQIATPTFENASQILLDSTITATNFSKTLELGNYEWRVRAENSEYQTLYITQNFSVEE
ncbi:hypothetical protein ES692_17225 [Psychroserpens burtonensis]|uniref:Uncharacterized protein n=1 Tax=Psychroserpens burtonensis TaxID=49278 RepID=A0A5C7B3K3_9FLAO|nr:hypothetical protein [Psychroserpens burtonensis]TXE15320.1 hypothetical protein ES692_17225 [Psychroserpens burtonensis]